MAQAGRVGAGQGRGRLRAYDHYVGWALHFYPLVWASLSQDPPAPELRRRWEGGLRQYLHDHTALIGADGSPLLQGRSLTYRMAAAAPLWVGAWAGASDLDPGLTRRAVSGIVRHFVDRGAPGADGLLTLGWHGAWPQFKQSYSGSGSPYWAVKALRSAAAARTRGGQPRNGRCPWRPVTARALA